MSPSFKPSLDPLVRLVDMNAVLERVDVDELLDRIDVNAVLDRVDIDRLLGRVDVQRLMARVDVDELVQRTELGSLVVRSTSGMASAALDAVRSQTVGLDTFVTRWADRLLRRPPDSRPRGPARLVPAEPTP
jgi:hypothetical protein